MKNRKSLFDNRSDPLQTRDLAILPDGTVGCLYEAGWWQPIVFAKFSMDWLTESKPSKKRKK